MSPTEQEESMKMHLKACLEACTTPHQNLFDKMYPDGIDNMAPDVLMRATEQVERTLKNPVSNG